MMHFALWQILLMFPIGIIGGIVSSCVGMASLITYPSLLYLGNISAITANVTNTCSMIWTGIGSGLSSFPELKNHKEQAIISLLLTLIGSLVGTALLLLAPSKDFKDVVPFFILFAGIMILLPNHKYKKQASTNSKNIRYTIYTIVFLLMGCYMAYFGAGAGTILISVLSIITTENYATYNAVRNVSALSANLTATIIYAIKATVYWSLVIPMGLGLFIGGYIGPKIVRVVPTKILKTIVGIGALGLSIYFFIQAYF